MRKTSLEMIYELAKKDDRICFIGSDLGAGTLDEFKREMPERFFMEGICEQNIVGIAAGLSMEGMIPYVNTIASFLTRRCFEQIVIDLCLHRANVRLIGNGGGLTYAPLGPTHETVEDLAILRAIPNMTVIAPADAVEMRRLMPLTVDHKGPIYIRLAKGYDPIVTENHPDFRIGSAVSVREGRHALLVATGITLKTALDASDILAAKGVEVSILHMPTIKPLDSAAILRHSADLPVIVTVEEHSIVGGLGSAVAEVVAEANFSTSKRFRRIGIPDEFPQGYGSQDSQMKRSGITAERVAECVLELLS